MGTAQPPKPVKYLVGLLSSQAQLLDQAESELAELLGQVEQRSDTLPWHVSRFYEPEMGSRLLRRFVSFAPLHDPTRLTHFKLCAQQIESRYRSAKSGSPGRQINIDPGYLDALKLVLASTKNACQRIYLDQGIYAEATLLYYDGGFHGLPYTYRDFLWPQTLEFLLALRTRYLQQLRALV